MLNQRAIDSVVRIYLEILNNVNLIIAKFNHSQPVVQNTADSWMLTTIADTIFFNNSIIWGTQDIFKISDSHVL